MLADERKPQESIEAATYTKANHLLREEIADQMADWVKKNKVTICPTGMMAGGQPLTTKKNLDEIKSGRADHTRERAKSGHLNVNLDEKTGKHVVAVSRHYVGTYNTAKEAVEARDVHRAKVGLPKATY